MVECDYQLEITDDFQSLYRCNMTSLIINKLPEIITALAALITSLSLLVKAIKGK